MHDRVGLEHDRYQFNEATVHIRVIDPPPVAFQPGLPVRQNLGKDWPYQDLIPLGDGDPSSFSRMGRDQWQAG